MAKTKRILAIGAVFISLTAGCDAEKSPEGNSIPSDAHSIPLAGLNPISVDGDPLGDLEDRPQIIAEVEYEGSRLIAYATSVSCGIVTTSKADPQHNDIQIVSKWPADGQGSNPYPAGPYNSASGNGRAKAWASLLCSKDAMVIDYSLDRAGSRIGRIRGEAIAAQLPDNRAASRIIVGEPATRQRIQRQADEPGSNASTPPAS